MHKLKIEDHGTFQLQLVEVGGPIDEEGMTQVVFRCKPEQAREMSAMLHGWIEAKCTSAKEHQPEPSSPPQ